MLSKLFIKAYGFKNLYEEAAKELKEEKPVFIPIPDSESAAHGKKYKNLTTGQEIWEDDLPEDAEIDEYGEESVKVPYEALLPKIKEATIQKEKKLQGKLTLLKDSTKRYFSEKADDEVFIDDLIIEIGDLVADISILKRLQSNKSLYETGVVSARMIEYKFGIE